MTKRRVEEILEELNYFEHFRNNYLSRTYKINYGKRKGELNINGFFDAIEKFKDYDEIYDETILEWENVLNDDNSDDTDLLITCLEIFEWGNVHSGNTKRVIEYYKKNELKQKISRVRDLLKLNRIIENEGVINWSSGWTKVYSFINSEIIIYDSRVSSFINHTLTYNSKLNKEQQKHIKELAKYLFNFRGNTDRERLIDNSWGFINIHPSGIDGFNANIVSSWIIQLINEKLGLNKSIRDLERAFFMLGFDLKQIKEISDK